MADWRDEEARNQTIFREMNEWIEDGKETGPGDDAEIDTYLCECSDRQCSDPIGLTRLEYESVRAEPLRFAIALNHENPEIDRLIAQNDRFATVEKFYGSPAKIARESDPRRSV
jgi:hypothetical protein